jgi:glycerol-3-phosphate O-acyltransferase
MHAPPLVALARGACPASPPPWAAPRVSILAPRARLLRSRRGPVRLEAKAAWRAAGGGRDPRVPVKGAVLASYMGAEEVVGPSPQLDELDDEGLDCCSFCFAMLLAPQLYSLPQFFFNTLLFSHQ